MQMKTAIERVDIKRGDLITRPPNSTRRRTLLPIAILFAMACAILLMDAVLPLREFWFNETQLTHLGSWPMLPSMLLFPDSPLISPFPLPDIPQLSSTSLNL